MAKHFKDNTDNRQKMHIDDYWAMYRKIPSDQKLCFDADWKLMVVSWIPLRYRGYIITKMKEQYASLIHHPLP